MSDDEVSEIVLMHGQTNYQVGIEKKICLQFNFAGSYRFFHYIK